MGGGGGIDILRFVRFLFFEYVFLLYFFGIRLRRLAKWVDMFELWLDGIVSPLFFDFSTLNVRCTFCSNGYLGYTKSS